MKDWKTGVIVLLLAAMVGLLFWNANLRKGAVSQAQDQAFQDTLKMGRRYDSLGFAVFDLKNELHSRTLGVILKEDVRQKPVPGQPPGVLPDPKVPTVPPASEAEVAAAARLVGNPERTGVTVAFSNSDIRNNGAESWLTSNGFKIQRDASLGDRATNALAFGSSVSLGAVQLVALELSRHGIHLRRIRESAADEPGVIRLDNVPHLETAPPLTVEQIQRLTQSP